MVQDQVKLSLELKERILYGYHCQCLASRFYRNLCHLACFSGVVYVCVIVPIFSPPLWFSACLGLYVGWRIGLMYVKQDKARRLSCQYLALIQSTTKITYDEALIERWQLRAENDFIPEPLECIAAIRANLAFDNKVAPYEGLPFRVRVYGWFAGCLFR